MVVQQSSKFLGNQSWSDVLRDFSDGDANGLLINIIGGNGELVNDFLQDGVVTAGRLNVVPVWSGT